MEKNVKLQRLSNGRYLPVTFMLIGMATFHDTLSTELLAVFPTGNPKQIKATVHQKDCETIVKVPEA